MYYILQNIFQTILILSVLIVIYVIHKSLDPEILMSCMCNVLYIIICDIYLVITFDTLIINALFSSTNTIS